MMREPVVRVANTDISGCDCVLCGATSLAQARSAAWSGARKQPPGLRRRRPSRRRPSHQRSQKQRGAAAGGAELTDGTVRYLGRLHGGAERQEGLLCAGEARVIRQSEIVRAIHLRLRLVRRRSRQRSFDHDRIRAEGQAANPPRGRRPSFAMYTQGDGLWIRTPRRKSRHGQRHAQMAEPPIKGVPAKAPRPADVFSLKGLALDRLARDCKRSTLAA